jgi:hypothetical protein
MQKKSEGAPEQHDLTDPGGDGASHGGVGLRSSCGGDQQGNQHNGTDA